MFQIYEIQNGKFKFFQYLFRSSFRVLFFLLFILSNTIVGIKMEFSVSMTHKNILTLHIEKRTSYHNIYVSVFGKKPRIRIKFPNGNWITNFRANLKSVIGIRCNWENSEKFL